MNVLLLEQVAIDISLMTLGRWSNISNSHDTAAYILTAAGHDVNRWLNVEQRPTPYFDQARKVAELPNDKLLWVGGWPEEYRKLLNDSYMPHGENDQEIADIVSMVVLDYVAEGGWNA